MSVTFLGEIRPFSFGFAPKGWALCNGQLLAIGQNQALFALLGTMYGGNGINTFALPDLRGRAGMHVGQNNVQGEKAGVESVTLTQGQIPLHNHPAKASNNPGTEPNPLDMVWAQDSNGNVVYNSIGDATMSPNAIGNAGGNQPHNNMQPYLVVNYCIALQGIFPSRN